MAGLQQKYTDIIVDIKDGIGTIKVIPGHDHEVMAATDEKSSSIVQSN